MSVSVAVSVVPLAAVAWKFRNPLAVSVKPFPENVADVEFAVNVLLPDVSKRFAVSVVPLAAVAVTELKPVARSKRPLPRNVDTVGAALNVLVPDASDRF